MRWRSLRKSPLRWLIRKHPRRFGSMRTGGRARVDVMFDASWWHKFYGIVFDETYVQANPRYRAILEGKMRRALYERFGSVGLGDKSSEPVPVISTQMVP